MIALPVSKIAAEIALENADGYLYENVKGHPKIGENHWEPARQHLSNARKLQDNGDWLGVEREAREIITAINKAVRDAASRNTERSLKKDVKQRGRSRVPKSRFRGHGRHSRY
ncbi:MAG: hypothetical protein A2172_01065 [Candidatus Woykebacteria bacterium RBG_13_40_15]|uniref:Uncharacterized protein n=1 Tax=Candidatus Woykebacteria bacterium RBG_13_40_15 TaxID=1802593 RepID=A0A1G1W9V6_9BACT|nr:MAG: hypothetical protein A2172_01065 [Candidatus Woykebacteria bacterium RBG_13_40_15]